MITEENSMRSDGVGTDNFLGEVGNLYISFEDLAHQHRPLATAPSSAESWDGGGSHLQNDFSLT